MIPKIVYMFWHDGRPDEPVRSMIRAAKRLNPGWRFRMLSAKTRCRKPDGFDRLEAVQHVSDWYRLYFLAKTGGVWMDVSCIHLRPLEAWVDVRSRSLIGFQWPLRGTVMENWAFAAPPEHPFVIQWRDEFARAIEMGFGKYERLARRRGTLPVDLLNFLPYLTQHACWRNVYDARATARDEVLLTRAMEPGRGPLSLRSLRDSDALDAAYMDTLLRAPASRFGDIPFIKLTSGYRDLFEAALDAEDASLTGHVPILLGWNDHGATARQRVSR